MKFTIVTVCYNSGNTLDRTIQSVLRQSYTDFEYIIIDGNSTDNTTEIVGKYVDHNAIKFISEKDNGPYDAMNKGITVSTGDVISFLNSDDYYLHEKVLEMVYHKIKAVPDGDFFYGDLLVVDNNAPAPYIKRHASIDRHYMCTNALAHPSMFHKKDCFAKNGFFNLEYSIVADYEWTLKAMYKSGLKGVYFDVVTTVFSAGGLSTNDVYHTKHLTEREKVIEEFFSKEEIQYFRSFFMKKKVQVKKGMQLINCLIKRFFNI